MANTAGPLPTFLIIGAQKSATRWLRQNLGLHPEVFTAQYELAFFNRRRYDQYGVDWYRAQFEGWSGERFVGEATPGYMMWHHVPGKVARRIEDVVPDVKLIAVLRNPVDRANSAMVHHKRRERIRPSARLLDLVRAQPPEEERFGLVTGGWYAASLRPYRRIFGDRLLVLLHDDVREDPRSVYRRAVEHVGAAPDFVPDALDEVVFSNQGKVRIQSDLSYEDRVELYEYFRDDIRQLERMFGLDLSIWAPDASPGSDGPWSRSSLVESYGLADAWIASVVERVPPEQYDAPTGDGEGTVRGLLERLIGSALYFSAVLTGTELGDPRTDEERAEDAARPGSGYGRASARLREAMVDERSLTPLGRFWAVNALAWQLVCAWELAVATHQHRAIPSGLADPVAGLTRELVGWLPRHSTPRTNGADTARTVSVLEEFLASLESSSVRS